VRFPDTLLRLGSLYRFFSVWALLCGASFWSSFSELGSTRRQRHRNHAHNTGVHIVTLFEHRELLAEIEMIFVRFPDLAVLRFSDSAFSTAFTRARNAANSGAHMQQVFLTGGCLAFWLAV